MEDIQEEMQELLSLIRSKSKPSYIKEELENYHDSDIAEVICYLTEEERKKLYRILGKERVSNVFTYLENVEDYIAELENETAADLIELMDADDALDVLQELEEEDKKQITSLMEKEALEDVRLLASFEDDQIGSKMTTNYIIVKKNDTIKSAMKHLIKYSKENDNIYTLFVKDENGKFYGSIDLKDLIRAREDDNLEDIIHTQYPYVYSTELIEECINDLKDASLDLYPVLNEKDELIGVITQDDLVEVVEDELTEDYAKLAGLNEAEEIDEPVFKSVKKRIVWLVCLLILGMFISLVVSQFETVIDGIPMIVFFQSVILGMSGNAGTQSLAVTIRGLMDEDLSRKKIAKMVFKEVRVGLTNGLILSIISFGAVSLFLYVRNTPILGETLRINDLLLIAGCVSGALIPAFILSSFIGCIVPIIFKKIKIDPAVASGPLITTLNDIVGIVSYYGLALLLFRSVL
ncbi:MAG: magnesium transporter [Bacilli bacterium]|nr:magnesium transporter [Bacilli bacterium]